MKRAVLVATLLASSFAQAHDVLIDPGQFTGFWWAPGQPFRKGPATISMATGTTAVFVGMNAQVTIDIDANGNVSPQEAASAVGGLRQLQLKTVPVVFEPGAFDGLYYVANVASARGTQTMQLVPTAGGRYGVNFEIGVHGIEFRVLPDGTVLRVTRPDSAIASGNTLTFLSAPVVLEPGNYRGGMYVAGTYPTFYGHTVVQLIRGLDFYVQVHQTWVFFEVLADGSVVSRRPTSAVGTGSTLRLLNTPVDIQPGGYVGRWSIGTYDGVYQRFGPAALTLVPDVTYNLLIDTNSLAFNVGSSGQVTVASGAQSLEGIGNALWFKNTTLTIDPGEYDRRWGPDALGLFQGAQSLVFVPGLRFGLNAVGYSTRPTLVVAEDGNWAAPIPAMVAAGGVGTKTLRLNPVRVRVDPGAYGGWYTAGESYRGAVELMFLAGFDYWFRLGLEPQKVVSVFAPCAVQPSELVFNGGTLRFTCITAPPDADADGIPDSADNCPQVANADQLDLDADGLGDVCDPDDDADGIADGADNCPRLPNADQTDADHDGVGDACDDDLDGDGVTNASDNCPWVANVDQADTDGDLWGDACDADDDDDGVPDTTDNCRLTSNPNQADFDGDGEGDACDGDRDGDGVANGADLCDATPHGVAVNADGCSGAQFIERQCVRANFANHGRYVSCVSHAATAAVSAGLISEEERGRYVSLAAKNK